MDLDVVDPMTRDEKLLVCRLDEPPRWTSTLSRGLMELVQRTEAPRSSSEVSQMSTWARGLGPTPPTAPRPARGNRYFPQEAEPEATRGVAIDGKGGGELLSVFQHAVYGWAESGGAGLIHEYDRAA